MRAIIMAAIAAALLPAPALAQMQCYPKDSAEKVLSKYGEQLFVVGAASDGKSLRIYANPETRTWTAIALQPNGLACVIGAGSSLDFVAPTKPEDTES